MGILADILGTGEIIKQGFDLIDDMHTSEVEAIEAKTKAKTDLLAAYAPFKKAQRLLAVMFTVTFLFCFVMVLLFTFGDYTEVDDVRKVMAEFYIAPIMFAIVGFYFGGGMLEGAFRAKNGKT
jgi:hypothetical protein